MKVAIQQSKSWSVFHYAFLIALAAIAMWISWEPLRDIIFRVALRDQEQTHILLVPIVVGWLAWIYRGRLQRIRYRPSLAGPAIIAAGWLVRWIGFETDLLVLQHISLLILLVGVATAMIGVRAVIGLAPLFIVLALFIPVPGSIRQMISVPLQGLATQVTYTILDFAGVPVETSGYLLMVRETPVNVGEACNGMRMIFALVLVTYAFVFSIPLRNSVRVVLVLLSPIIAIVCNVIRLIPTALIYGQGSTTAAAEFHDIAGWLMLPVALGLLFALVRLLQWLELPVMQWRYRQ